MERRVRTGRHGHRGVPTGAGRGPRGAAGGRGELRLAPPGPDAGERLAAIVTDLLFRQPALRIAQSRAKRTGAASTHVFEFDWATPVFGLGPATPSTCPSSSTRSRHPPSRATTLRKRWPTRCIRRGCGSRVAVTRGGRRTRRRRAPLADSPPTVRRPSPIPAARTASPGRVAPDGGPIAHLWSAQPLTCNQLVVCWRGDFLHRSRRSGRRALRCAGRSHPA